MLTLRAKLVIATLSLGVAIMLIFLVALTVIGGPLISVPIETSVAAAAAEARALVAEAPAGEHDDALVNAIVARAQAHGVDVAIIPPGETMHAMHGPGGPPNLGRLLGLRGETVAVRGGVVLIMPAPAAVDAAVHHYLLLAGAAMLLSLIVSFAIARWSATQAVTPLLAVTRELERFAAGDFRTHSLVAKQRGEFLSLVTAFNGAAQQVRDSFAERARAEAEMNRFVADASHELRTPLTVVTGFVDVLRRGGDADPKLRENAYRRIEIETRRMRDVVERLLVLARMDRLAAAAPEIVDLAEVAREAIAARAADPAAVRLNVEGSAAYVRADPVDLHEAIGNLIENASKYGRCAAVDVVRENGSAVVRVSDAGPGIAPGDVDKIFERFFRSESTRAVPGSGLGLAIAAGAAKRAGGSLTLDDPSPGHTTFTLRVPLLAEQ